MLVLKRRKNETIKLYDHTGRLLAVVHVRSTHQRRVSIGIDADESLRVLRGELADAKVVA